MTKSKKPKKSSHLPPVVSELLTVAGLGALGSTMLQFVFEFAKDYQHAVIAGEMACLLAWIVLFGVRKLPIPLVQADSYGRFSSLLCLLVALQIVGYVGRPLFSPRPSPVVRQKPSSIKLRKPVGMDQLEIDRLAPYREWLAGSANNKFLLLIRSEPFSFATKPFSCSIGPGKSIDTGFAFRIHKENGNGDLRVQVLDMRLAKDSTDELVLSVPEGEKGDYILLLVRTFQDTRLYVGDLK